MTELEQANLDAFTELLNHSGDGKSFLVGSGSVKGLVQYIEPQDATYSLEDGEGQDAIVQVLKAEWPSDKKRVGSVFKSPDDEYNFRIKNRRGTSLFYFFKCEVTDFE